MSELFTEPLAQQLIPASPERLAEPFALVRRACARRPFPSPFPLPIPRSPSPFRDFCPALPCESVPREPSPAPAGPPALRAQQGRAG